MSPNKRIFLNVIATYGRSLYALLIGLVAGRWSLLALGEVDFGLMGVVGGLTVFISFFNNILAGSISRFYAFSVGAAQKVGNEEVGLEECRRWFSVAVSVHTVLPLMLVLIGYPLGTWAIENYLTIPLDRVCACLWVFRFVCVTCLLSMISVPLQAMYTAKQYIAELTIYSFVTSTLHVVILYYMVTHPGVWLVKLAFCSCLLAVIPSLIISIRAYVIFPECRLCRKHIFNISDIRELLSFAGWNFFGALGNLFKGPGVAVLVNKMLGPILNASMNVANTVAGHAQTLAGAMVGAFIPAITAARGADDYDRMISLVHKICKFGAVLILPFAIPLALEIDEVMILWLKDPPAQSGFLCIWLMAVLILENMTTGHWVVISANGKIAWYQFIVGSLFIATLPIAWMMMKCGHGIHAVGYALFTTLAFVAVVRIIAVKILLGISPRYWLCRILVPIVGVSVVSTAIGYVPSLFMSASFWRVCMTTIVSNIILIPLILFVVLDATEREFLKSKLYVLVDRIRRFNG